MMLSIENAGNEWKNKTLKYILRPNEPIFYSNFNSNAIVCQDILTRQCSLTTEIWAYFVHRESTNMFNMENVRCNWNSIGCCFKWSSATYLRSYSIDSLVVLIQRHPIIKGFPLELTLFNDAFQFTICLRRSARWLYSA